MEIQTYTDVTFNDEATRFLKSHVAKMLTEPEIKTYVDNERRFLEAKPWKQLVGLTPEEAINKLEELGF